MAKEWLVGQTILVLGDVLVRVRFNKVEGVLASDDVGHRAGASILHDVLAAGLSAATALWAANNESSQ
jgi:hypothetical protein